jgi:polysaccharide export outer membrane protein
MKITKKSLALFLGLLFLLAGQNKIAVADIAMPEAPNTSVDQMPVAGGVNASGKNKNPVPSKATAADYSIGANDLLRITVFGYDDMKTETRVSADGRITFPLIGEVSVAGKSTSEVEQKLASLLVRGDFIADPQVSVMVLEFKSQQVTVLGQVNKPGRYALDSASTLADLIAMAGGVNPAGDDRVILTRRNELGETTVQEVDLRKILESLEKAEQIKMRQGDIVYVRKVPVFYIYGEVTKAGAYTLEPALSVAQALSLGGGLTPRGSRSGIVITRTDKKGKAEEIDAEMTDAVQKGDVIFVGERWF